MEDRDIKEPWLVTASWSDRLLGTNDNCPGYSWGRGGVGVAVGGVGVVGGDGPMSHVLFKNGSCPQIKF